MSKAQFDSSDKYRSTCESKLKIAKRMFVRDSCRHSTDLFTSCCSEKKSPIIPLKELSQGGTLAGGN